MNGCEKCGRLDSTLRGAIFGYAVSLLVVTFRRPGSAGVFCSRCRKKEAFKYSLVSALFGWWGIPWGPIYTLQTIGQNSAGGVQSDEFNANLLGAVGAELADDGNRTEALRALERSLSIRDQPEVRQLLWAIQGSAAPHAPAREPDVQPPAQNPSSSNERLLRPPRISAPVQVLGPGDLVTLGAAALLRKLPSDDSDLLAALGPGDAVVIGSSDGWTNVRAMAGQTGWVRTESLEKRD